MLSGDMFLIRWLIKLLRLVFPEKQYEKPDIPYVPQQKFYPPHKDTPPRGFGPDWRKLK